MTHRVRRLPLFVNAIFCLATVGFAAASAQAAVGVQQLDNAFDRPHERLPDLNLVRGGRLKTIPLSISAGVDEAWTLQPSAPWIELSALSGTGPMTVALTFDYALLAEEDDVTGTVLVIGPDGGDPGSNVASIDVAVDIWPKRTAATTRAELRAFVKDRANWPSDSSYADAWELWGFLPDEVTHPGTGSGRNMDAWEKTPCPEGQDRDDCVSEGQAGLAAGQSADMAWLLSTGDPRVTVAVLDSGIKWDEDNLLTKHYLNAEELRACPPPGADVGAVDAEAAFDVNGDGVFNIRDYDEAEWLSDINGNGKRDPQDLIHATYVDDAPCSDGLDADENGYVDDISGWDFFWNDNDPSDDASYGHGTGEANDSTGEAHDDRSSLGICPRCRVLSVRVGDSFIVDVNQFADGVVFAVESGAKVVQEALGSLNNTPYAQAAIDYAYDNKVAVIASAADERSYHHNYPGSLEHTFYVHAIVADTDGDFEDAATFLNFGNCTNWGGKLMLSTPGTGCSSEATGKTSGQAGLTFSYFEQLRDAAQGTALEDYYAPDLTAEELYQVLASSGDDIDVPGMETDEAALAAKRYPSNEGWDLQFGYGRNNSRRGLELLRDQKIPPEVDVSAPRWYQVFDPERDQAIEVRGTITSPRLDLGAWRVLVGVGNPPAAMVEVASGTGPVDDGVLASISLAKDGPLADLVARAADPAGDDPEEFSATLEVQAIGEGPAGEVVGRFRKVFAVRHDPGLRPGFPIFLGASGESSPKLTDLDGDGSDEIVVGTADGLVHAISADGTELPGFPAGVNTYLAHSDAMCGTAANPKCHRNARAFKDGHIAARLEALGATTELRSSIIATVAIGDLDNDGSPGRDVVAATIDGTLVALDSEGEMLEGFPVSMDPSHVAEFTGALTCERNGAPVLGCRTKQRHAEMGFFSSPMLVDLDGDGDLEIVIGGLDQWAYAWHHTGEVVNGWPVHVVNEAVPAYDSVGGVFRYDGRIISSPVVADIFGDGTPVTFVGTNERVENSSESYLYAIWPDGNAHSGGPFLPGWPARLSGFIPDEILPFVGRGNPNSPAAADVDGDGAEEVINAGLGGDMVVLGADGAPELFMNSTREYYGEKTNVEELASLPVINNPSVADLDGDGRLDIVNGTAGIGLVAVASSGGQRAEFDHSVSAWVSENGYFLDGFPHRVWDYQFFMNYTVADLDGDNLWNVISGDGGYFVYAPDPDGEEAPGFPKFTSQWHIATPAVGDLDGDQRIDVVANTREGWLWVWSNEGHVGGPQGRDLPAIQWGSFHHDDANTGNWNTPLREYPRARGPDDGDYCEAACCCQAAQSAGEGRRAALGGVAALFVLGTVFLRRRRVA